MRVLVAYMSKSGNTQKVAEAIYGEIACDKEIKRVEDVTDLEGYDLAFLGFPVHASGPNPKARQFLENQTPGRQIALFITHASHEGEAHTLESLAKFEVAAAGATLLGTFDCRGQLAKGIKRIMSIMPDRQLRQWAKQDDSQGQPDAERLERARAFGREIMAKVGG
ncbi:MAG: flavodoxin [Anaerolineae bacterium]|nr:flavodoxin [Anaerolineae bacterium]